MLYDKKSGWLFGAIAGMFAVFYFLFLKLYIYSLMEFSIFILMSYGYIFFKEIKPKYEFIVNLFIILILSLLSFFVFSGLLTIIEYTSSITFIVGTYFFNQRKIFIGWFLFIFSHLGSTYLGYIKEEYFFMYFQIASIVVAIIGMAKNRNS